MNKVAECEGEAPTRLTIRAANLAAAHARMPSKAEESRVTAFHFSTRQKGPGCRADKVKHCGELRRMTRSVMQFHHFNNMMSQMLMLQL